MMTVGLHPAALGPGDSSPADRQGVPDQFAQMAPSPNGAAARGPTPLTTEALLPPESGREAGPLPDRAPPPDALALKPQSGGGDAPDLPLLRPEPAGPLKTFAQIPMEIVQEITRLREEAEQARISGVPGRNDPTPMPARPEAIGARMPYDAA